MGFRVIRRTAPSAEQAFADVEDFIHTYRDANYDGSGEVECFPFAVLDVEKELLQIMDNDWTDEVSDYVTVEKLNAYVDKYFYNKAQKDRKQILELLDVEEKDLSNVNADWLVECAKHFKYTHRYVGNRHVNVLKDFIEDCNLAVSGVSDADECGEPYRGQKTRLFLVLCDTAD